MPLSPFSACSSFFPFPLANLFLLFASPDIVVRSPAPAPHWLYSPRSCGGTNLQILSAQDVIPSCQQITISPPVVTAVAPAPCRVPTQHCVLTVPNLFRASVPTWHHPPAVSRTAHHTTCSAQQQPLPLPIPAQHTQHSFLARSPAEKLTNDKLMVSWWTEEYLVALHCQHLGNCLDKMSSRTIATITLLSMQCYEWWKWNQLSRRQHIFSTAFHLFLYDTDMRQESKFVNEWHLKCQIYSLSRLV